MEAHAQHDDVEGVEQPDVDHLHTAHHTTTYIYTCAVTSMKFGKFTIEEINLLLGSELPRDKVVQY